MFCQVARETTLSAGGAPGVKEWYSLEVLRILGKLGSNRHVGRREGQDGQGTAGKWASSLNYTTPTASMREMNVDKDLNNMEEISTKLLVSDYINFRLQKQNLEWPDRPTLPPQPGRVARTMRALGEEFEQRYTEVFQQMCNQLHITPNTAHPTFTAIVNELFSDGVKWGRVVALFSFGGSLAVQCVEKEMPPLVDQIVEWVAGYVDNRLQSWITEHGGWEGFVEFYEGGPERRNESPWPSFKTICSYAAGAIGVLTLGAILSQKS